HFLTQIPQPMQRNSEMNAILSEGLTSMHSLPNGDRRVSATSVADVRTFLHSCAHLFGLHLLESTIAMRVILSCGILYPCPWLKQGQ
ncbi:hypothetical protein K488DRAFT_52292, partial [Vararia minispora EC-137]